jgi:hypothetical protein
MIEMGGKKRINKDFYGWYPCFVAVSFRPSPSVKMGGADRCGILSNAGSIATYIGLL